MKEKIKEILGEVKDNPDLAITLSDDADIINDVGLDSLQMITFILQIEEELDFEFDFDIFDYSHLSSIDIFCQFISEQKTIHDAKLMRIGC